MDLLCVGVACLIGPGGPRQPSTFVRDVHLGTPQPTSLPRSRPYHGIVSAPATPPMTRDGTSGARLPPGLLRLASDERLVQHVRGGSERAFEALFARHHRGLLAFCRHMLGSPRRPRTRSSTRSWPPTAASRGSERGDRAAAVALHDRPQPLPLGAAGAARAAPLAALEPADGAPHGGRRAPAGPARPARRPRRPAATTSGRRSCSPSSARCRHAEIADVVGCRREKVKALVFQATSVADRQPSARATPCEEIREQLATLSGGELRRTELRRHLRECPGCRAFRDDVAPPAARARAPAAGRALARVEGRRPRRRRLHGRGGGRRVRLAGGQGARRRGPRRRGDRGPARRRRPRRAPPRRAAARPGSRAVAIGPRRPQPGSGGPSRTQGARAARRRGSRGSDGRTGGAPARARGRERKVAAKGVRTRRAERRAAKDELAVKPRRARGPAPASRGRAGEARAAARAGRATGGDAEEGEARRAGRARAPREEGEPGRAQAAPPESGPRQARLTVARSGAREARRRVPVQRSSRLPSAARRRRRVLVDALRGHCTCRGSRSTRQDVTRGKPIDFGPPASAC